MRDMPTHYKLITPPFIKFHDRCLLRQRALYASRRPSLSLSLSLSLIPHQLLSRRYIHYLFTRVYNPSNGDWRNRPPIRSPPHPRPLQLPRTPLYNRPPRCSTPLSRSLLIMFHPAFENPRVARRNRKWLRCSVFQRPIRDVPVQQRV